ncbi:MAG: helix-hairpin-helix domain-containing protein [Betaproteobacteria bacterium]
MTRLWKALALALVTQFGIALAAAAAVNINTATKDELVALPGIGPAKAQAILDYRKLNGPFKSVDDLKNVKGIGAKRLDKLRPDLSVGPAPAKVAVAGSGAKADAKGQGPTVKGEVRGADGKSAK